jgi:hypothetical protein
MNSGICKSIKVLNPIEKQLDYLENIQQKMSQDDWDPASIQSKETRIHIHFHSLRTTECLEHDIPVKVIKAYIPEKR